MPAAAGLTETCTGAVRIFAGIQTFTEGAGSFPEGVPDFIPAGPFTVPGTVNGV